MLLMEPTNSPNARGSLHPPRTGIAENMALGEKSTDVIVCLMPLHSPSSKRLSHGIAYLRSVDTVSSLFSYSNLFPHRGHRIHRAPGGIFLRDTPLVKLQSGHLMSIIPELQTIVQLAPIEGILDLVPQKAAYAR